MPTRMTDHGPQDSQQMARIAQGDMKALGQIYLKHADRVLAVTARVVPELPKQDIEDICQEVFLALPDLASRYEERGRLSSWLIGVAIRKARNRRRNQWIRRNLLREKSDLVPKPTATAAPDRDLRQAMDQAFTRLSQKYREVLVLHVIEGMDAAQIGEILGLRPGSVWARLHRARKALQKTLERTNVDGRLVGDAPPATGTTDTRSERATDQGTFDQNPATKKRLGGEP